MAQLECLVDSTKKDDLAVIFIHGLNGDARGTWMMDEKDDSTLWPRWLASDVDCSVWVLGYDAKLSSWQDNAMPLPDQGDSVLETLATEEGLKNRPLLLIGHSMGGLVIKTLIHHGRTKGVARYESVVKRIRGVSFVATPHNGSQLATLAQYMAFLLRTNPQVGNMQNHDAHLRSLNQQFLAYFNAQDTCVAVRTFAERKPVQVGVKFFKPIKVLVVDANSSEPHVPHEIAVPLPEDHISICKLANKGDQLYKSLLAFIKEDVLPKSQPLQKSDVETVGESTEPPPADKIQITKLPHTNSHLFGREAEIAMLDRAWAEGCNVLILKAMGGTGKTALLKYWLDQFVASGYRGAEAVFTWSFYSQGSAENKQTSTDDFFESALRFFGYVEQNLPPPHERGIKLARLVASQRTLLILDGLEPLQHPVGIFHGELKDQALKALLQQLAVKNPGLCLISSRQTVEELKGKPEKLVLAHDLEQLQEKDGVALLRAIGVKGTDVELTKAVKEVAGHALALNLLGNYVKKVLSGDIRQRDKIPGLMAERNDGKHAEKMLAAYETHLKGTPALSVLYLLGLFDRPVSPGAIQCLKEAKIPELTDQLGGDADWCYAIDDLREQRLLNAPNPDYPDNLDCHPLIREYFGGQLQTQQPQAWPQAHERLYEYYKALPEKLHNQFLPKTLKEMEHLFSAVAHGCAAGLHQQAMREVYWLRIRRKDEAYIVKKLGAFSDALATIAHFFVIPWQTPAVNLIDADKAALLSWAGFCLRALGRLREAVEPMQANVEMTVQQEDWKEAAIAANNLSELQLLQGKIKEAKLSSECGIDFAVKSNIIWIITKARATRAHVVHQCGKTTDAFKLFHEIENPVTTSVHLQLTSIEGSRYCDLLLTQGNIEEVIKRSKQALERNMSPLTIALDRYILGCAYLQQKDFSQADHWLTTAVGELRKYGGLHYLPLGLLAHADMHRHTHDFARARQDLQEVFDIADGSGMRLHLTDYHLEMARLLVAEEKEGNRRLPLQADVGATGGRPLQYHIAEAAKLINETGYHRRDQELLDLQQALAKESCP
ncbi:hypothetical protein HMY34_10880 [Thiothrix subterranea]|uniref:hypothetical protein n=1 Tax=Thiothrix subterranea TaxID=2735563 RepID=UPI00192C83CE|nr:hypothetical protein [Thiothrix subterranea]QQZ29232.1 hypothetical protein HMY34_10880 [Thiothrix subterranea]